MFVGGMGIATPPFREERERMGHPGWRRLCGCEWCESEWVVRCCMGGAVWRWRRYRRFAGCAEGRRAS